MTRFQSGKYPLTEAAPTAQGPLDLLEVTIRKQVQAL